MSSIGAQDSLKTHVFQHSQKAVELVVSNTQGPHC